MVGESYQLFPMPPVPLVRVAEVSPILHTGLDYLDNFMMKSESGDAVKVHVASSLYLFGISSYAFRTCT